MPINKNKPVDPPVVTKPEPVENEYYTTGVWSGMAQWKCRECAWDTVESEDELLAHYYKKHILVPNLTENEKMQQLGLLRG